MAPALVRGSNRRIVLRTITWDGVKDHDHIAIPLVEGRPLLLRINNSDLDAALTATFDYKVTADEYAQWFDGGGDEIKFTVPAGKDYVYGPFEGFPRFLGGQLTLTGSGALTNEKVTTVTIYEM
jgi:hypothetical protein